MSTEIKYGYKPDTSFTEALLDGWSRDLPISQRIEELNEIGFTVTECFLNMFNENMNKEVEREKKLEDNLFRVNTLYNLF